MSALAVFVTLGNFEGKKIPLPKLNFDEKDP